MTLVARKILASTQRGLGLVEVLVAMAIGLILLLGLSALFIKSTTTFKANDDFSRMQENGNFALNTIANDLRMAGFYGFIASNDIGIPVAVTITNCSAGWATKFSEPLTGFYNLADGAAATVALSCIKPNNFVSNSSILVIRGASGIRVLPAALDASTLYVQADPNGGILFKGGDYATFSVATKRAVRGAGGVAQEAPIYSYQAKAYYLRPCSKPTGAGGICLATDDTGYPIPTLVRQELVGTTMTETAIAEGIEAWRILYGVDSVNADGIPDTYVENPTAAQFLQVVSARISVLVRAAKSTRGYNDDGKIYDLGGDGTPDFTCTAGINCDYHRHVFTQSLQVRNLAQRLEAN